MRVCPECGQSVSFEQHVASLSPARAAVFGAMANAGPHGVSLDDIGSALAATIGRTPNAHTLRQHIFQLGRQIAWGGYRIERLGKRRPSRWALVPPTPPQERAA